MSEILTRWQDPTIKEMKKQLQQKDKEIERLKEQIEEYQKALDETMSEKIDLENIIKEAIEYITSIKDEDIQYTIGWVKQDILQILEGE